LTSVARLALAQQLWSYFGGKFRVDGEICASTLDLRVGDVEGGARGRGCELPSPRTSPCDAKASARSDVSKVRASRSGRAKCWWRGGSRYSERSKARAFRVRYGALIISVGWGAAGEVQGHGFEKSLVFRRRGIWRFIKARRRRGYGQIGCVEAALLSSGSGEPLLASQRCSFDTAMAARQRKLLKAKANVGKVGRWSGARTGNKSVEKMFGFLRADP